MRGRSGFALCWAGVLLTSALCSPQCAADGNAAAGRRPACAWLSLGLGLGSPGGLAGDFSAHYLTPSNHILSLRTVGTVPPPFGEGHDSSEIGFLYGWASRGPTTIRSIALGLSLTNSGHHGSGWDWVASTERRSTLGLPLEAQVIWAPLPVVGVGLTAFGDLNPKQSSAGLLLSMHLGKLR